MPLNVAWNSKQHNSPPRDSGSRHKVIDTETEKSNIKFIANSLPLWPKHPQPDTPEYTICIITGHYLIGLKHIFVYIRLRPLLVAACHDTPANVVSLGIFVIYFNHTHNLTHYTYHQMLLKPCQLVPDKFIELWFHLTFTNSIHKASLGDKLNIPDTANFSSDGIKSSNRIEITVIFNKCFYKIRQTIFYCICEFTYHVFYCLVHIGYIASRIGWI